MPPGGYDDTVLVTETKSMYRQQRLAEQEGERQLSRVHAREHLEETPTNAPEGELQNSIMQHPYLDNQRYDGVDPNLSPEPPLNSEARREYDNAKREQENRKEQELQLRLGATPQFSSTPRPRGPS